MPHTDFFILKYLFFTLCCLLPLPLSAQFDKAHEAFNQKRYAAAAQIYEAGLKEKSNHLAESRLAFCYRMLNKTGQAEQLYARVVTSEKAKNDSYLYYAEALMGNGKYTDAKVWFLKYFEREPRDSFALSRAAACDLVPHIQPYFKGLKMEPFAHNSEADDNSPAFWQEGLVFTSDRASGSALLKEKSGWTGRDFLKLWFSKYDPKTATFKEPKPFSGKFNELNKNTANASFSGNWDEIFFSRNGNTPNRKEEYTLQLYTASRAGNRWKNEQKLDFCRTDLNYMHPSVSADGKRVFFAANGGGQGGFDIFTAEKNKAGEWRRVQNLGSIVNTSAHEAFPYFHRDGRLFFCSKGHPGFGGFDIFVTHFDSVRGDWVPPVNLGRPINSSLDDLGFYLAANDSTGAFTSGRDGGDDNLYLFWLGEKLNFASIFYPKDTTHQLSKMVAPSTNDYEKTTGLGSTLRSVVSLDTSVQNKTAKVGDIFIMQLPPPDSLPMDTLPEHLVLELLTVDTILKKHPTLRLEMSIHVQTLGDETMLLNYSKQTTLAVQDHFKKSRTPSKVLRIRNLNQKYPRFLCPPDADCPPSWDVQNNRLELKISRL